MVCVHTSLPHLKDWIQNELAESSREAFPSSLVPLLFLAIEELVSPETLHEFGGLNLELVRVDLGKLLEGEGPSVQTRTKANSTLSGVNLRKGGERVT